ncbi:hypothetical protein FQR65_LT03898 [Abscondita terminalis]|nr:hypothetical protein FQR65_LT03898 [Abscondita terminalis]
MDNRLLKDVTRWTSTELSTYDRYLIEREVTGRRMIKRRATASLDIWLQGEKQENTEASTSTEETKVLTEPENQSLCLETPSESKEENQFTNPDTPSASHNINISHSHLHSPIAKANQDKSTVKQDKENEILRTRERRKQNPPKYHQDHIQLSGEECHFIYLVYNFCHGYVYVLSVIFISLAAMTIENCQFRNFSCMVCNS